ncbi:ASCH domain-containing protein [Pandoraea apista]|uniref:ASCH domain-containing protein n=1 Tax=Pandoraea apista TaxID=93218 RepID=A0A5E5P697_9BURK|nr:ASCH domain-containing protein [Pandoraea apista]AJF00060.1 hypothetical protein SG18_21105 [Pandoraea apista]AKH74215.1 hypothetical protein XM39_21290 [Pandoraea apista]AKI62764.1 hypothetical protein AA956_14605 [Pandoraea apista]VVG72111.1 hypothetical protein PAP18089_03104 [Pandoraea apista]
MHLLNFQSRFEQLIISGRKPHTIRAKRVDGRDPQPGDVLRLYVGLRSSRARIISQEVCEYVSDIQFLPPLADRVPQVFIGDRLLDESQVEALAYADGFQGWREMVDFIADQYGLPFTGNLIGWIHAPSYVRTQ